MQLIFPVLRGSWIWLVHLSEPERLGGDKRRRYILGPVIANGVAGPKVESNEVAGCRLLRWVLEHSIGDAG